MANHTLSWKLEKTEYLEVRNDINEEKEATSYSPKKVKKSKPPKYNTPKKSYKRFGQSQ